MTNSNNQLAQQSNSKSLATNKQAQGSPENSSLDELGQRNIAQEADENRKQMLLDYIAFTEADSQALARKLDERDRMLDQYVINRNDYIAKRNQAFVERANELMKGGTRSLTETLTSMVGQVEAASSNESLAELAGCDIDEIIAYTSDNPFSAL